MHRERHRDIIRQIDPSARDRGLLLEREGRQNVVSSARPRQLDSVSVVVLSARRRVRRAHRSEIDILKL